MTFFRFDVLAFTWMLAAFLRDLKVLPKAATQVLSGILLGLMLFALLVSAHVVGLP